jgi:hypothetical protein
MALAIVYDAIAAGNDPPDGDGYLGYVNGQWADYDATVARFPGKPVKSVSVWGLDALAIGADIADCESGDYAPTDAALWAHNKIAQGQRPCIYSSTSDYQAIAAALWTYTLEFGRDCDWFEAHYDNVAALSSNPGAVGKQYQSTAGWDVSVCDPVWLGIVPVPTPPPTDTRVRRALSIIGGF